MLVLMAQFTIVAVGLLMLVVGALTDRERLLVVGLAVGFCGGLGVLVTLLVAGWIHVLR